MPKLIGISAGGSGGGGGGGGSTFPKFTGSGSPEGVQAAVLGESYEDTTNGGIYFKAGVDGENTGWWAAGAQSNLNPGQGYGFAADAGSLLVMAEAADGGVSIGDVGGWNGTGNGLYWQGGGVDGNQYVTLYLGSSGQFNHLWSADGVYHAPGEIDLHNPANTGAGVAILDDYQNWGPAGIGLYPLPLGAAANLAELAIYDENITPSGSFVGGAAHSAVLSLQPLGIAAYDWGSFSGGFTFSAVSDESGAAGRLVLEADASFGGIGDERGITVDRTDRLGGVRPFEVYYDGRIQIQNPSNTGGGFAIVDDYRVWGTQTLGVYPTPLGAAAGGATVITYDQNINPDGSFVGGATHAKYGYYSYQGFQAGDWGTYQGQASLSLRDPGAGFFGELALKGDDAVDGDWDAISVKSEPSGAVALSVAYGGRIMMPTLPSADPHVAGQLYTTATVLHVSAG